ncbi:MAG: type II CRISPR RNA-guided endonuclease Cas9, partial [Abditibacteriota bacterium]|nr:type II CRISPR RNA-guided endonuclease Cas9 [Abditibacteriota bacterium]
YAAHKEQLKTLKAFFRKYFPDDYGRMFRQRSVKDNYVNYIRWGWRDKFDDKVKASGRNEFYAALKTKLDSKKDEYSPEDTAVYEDIIQQMADNSYLLKLRISENGAIPYQLHKDELEKIIDRQGLFYPELRDNKDKLLSLIEYRIPYYVGPVRVSFEKDGETRVNSQFAWTVKKPGHEHDRIYPWNEWDRNPDESVRVIDRQQSANDFINRMRNKCTYLPSEDTLPKHSLLFSEYWVLNEVNKVRVRGHLIDRRVRDDLIESCFKKKSKVTIEDLRNILRKNGESDWATVRITGTSKPDRFLAQMLAWKDFGAILGGITAYDKPMIEKLVLWITLFEDKRVLREKIVCSYGSRLSEEQINKICKLSYKGWGSISGTLLTDIKGYDQSENARSREICSVIDQLRMSNHNLMEIINYPSYEKSVKEFNEQHREPDMSFWKRIDGLAGSPALKRGIRQTFRIIDEITGIMKCPPVSVYIEVPREDGEKGKATKSRHELLSELYSDLSTDPEFDGVRASLKRENDKALQNDRLFLYYTQGGKCMYSGEPLDINSLNNYQVDHIVPQSLIKDDSIDNRVLVKAERNQRKS